MKWNLCSVPLNSWVNTGWYRVELEVSMILKDVRYGIRSLVRLHGHRNHHAYSGYRREHRNFQCRQCRTTPPLTLRSC